MAEDEFVEDADPLLGETAPGLGDAQEIPVRLLDNFTIYDWDTLQLVPIAHLLDLRPGTRYGASGLVRPWIDDNEDDDSDDSDEDNSVTPVVMKLSSILELNVHHFSLSTSGLDV